MPTVATSPAELIATLAGAAHIDGERLVVDDEAAFRDRVIRDLAWTAAFTTDDPTAEAARWLVWEASQALGARSASIQDLYMARAQGEVSGFTVPAINIRAQTFDMARVVYEAAEAGGVGAVILELARSEQTYTFQRPMDYATSVLAGAIAAGWQGPVFLQGDHYQFNAKKYATDPESMTEEIRRACRLAIDAGYRNIDIDSSTLVDLSRPDVDEEQRDNYERAAELTALIRTLESDGVTVSVGGEIGEVGKENSTEAELRAFLDGYRRDLDARMPGAIGISKVSVQTGTSHGGSVLPDGTVARVAVDFSVHARLGEIARREYGLAGTVQHGASTLPERGVPPLPRGRDRRDPPRDGLPERALRPPGLPGRPPRARSTPGATPTPPTSASRVRPTSSSSTRRARRRSGRSSASCGTSRRRTRSSHRRPGRSASFSANWVSTRRATWSIGTSRRCPSIVRHRTLSRRRSAA